MKQEKFNTGIYQIINLVNGKRYIGSAVKLDEREYNHFNNLNNNKHPNKHLQFSYNRYGEKSFKFEVVMHTTEENCLFFEQIYVDKYDLKKELYNKRKKVNSNLGLKASGETKKKMSEAKKGKTFSKEHRNKISKARKGIEFSKETKRKMSEASIGPKNKNYGKQFSKETIKKMSEAQKGEKNPNWGRKLSEEHKRKIAEGSKNKNSKAVYQIDKNTNEIIKKWNSITEATNKLNLHTTSISKVCKKQNNRKTCGGFKWKYANKD